MGVLLRLVIVDIQQNSDNLYNCHEVDKKARLTRTISAWLARSSLSGLEIISAWLRSLGYGGVDLLAMIGNLQS